MPTAARICADMCDADGFFEEIVWQAPHSLMVGTRGTDFQLPRLF